MIKLKWLQDFINIKNRFWFHILSKIFLDCGGIEYLLACDFSISKLPLKLSKFPKQVLLNWKMVYSHNFTPHNAPTWNNRCILLKRKSLYYEDWVKKVIWSVAHLIDSSGSVFSCPNFKEKYGLQCWKRQYNTVMKVIPLELLVLVNRMLRYDTIIPKPHLLMVNDVEFKNKNCSNKSIRTTTHLHPLPLKRMNALKEFLSDIKTESRTKSQSQRNSR